MSWLGICTIIPMREVTIEELESEEQSKAGRAKSILVVLEEQTTKGL